MFRIIGSFNMLHIYIYISYIYLYSIHMFTDGHIVVLSSCILIPSWAWCYGTDRVGFGVGDVNFELAQKFLTPNSWTTCRLAWNGNWNAFLDYIHSCSDITTQEISYIPAWQTLCCEMRLQRRDAAAKRPQLQFWWNPYTVSCSCHVGLENRSANLSVIIWYKELQNSKANALAYMAPCYSTTGWWFEPIF